MSELLYARPAPPARPFPLAEMIGTGRSPFARDARFVPAAERTEDEHRTAQAAADLAEDPVQRAFAEGYAQGADDARAAAMAEMAETDAARHRIETSLSRMDADAVRQLQDRLRQTVLALCEAAIAPAAIDPDALARRVEKAAGMLARAEDARVIRLHPEDLALVHARLPEDWHCEPDPALERGAIRIEGALGGVEDGPDQWRRALEEALRQC
ncbi:FliH/SctL family protein [Novosphingobium sp. KCTC 2891]|uniref:FliH/SctL family protein n=1 Tax=Novosphingobium sp. KCTC 2891 TaxID=2989730 RepID=UPI0022223137|nr:FliH/SctL family protein [Novosphingobium sp. KCTC 2891]MCW1383009.1 FliH/SctL family protein [Novosphingobium sp. KCTC 2891]